MTNWQVITFREGRVVRYGIYGARQRPRGVPGVHAVAGFDSDYVRQPTSNGSRFQAWASEPTVWRIELEELIDAGEHTVVAMYRQTATGRASGVPVELHQGAIHEFRDGRVCRIENFPTPEEALEAAGLSE